MDNVSRYTAKRNEMDLENGIQVRYGANDAGSPAFLQIGHAHGYHAAITGASGSGKSRFLGNVIRGIVSTYGPDDVKIWLPDCGNGECEDYLDPRVYPNVRVFRAGGGRSAGQNLLFHLKTMCGFKTRLLKEVGARTIDEYNALDTDDKGEHPAHMPFQVLVIDDTDALISGLEPDEIEQMAETIDRCRPCGIAALAAAQCLTRENQRLLLGKNRDVSVRTLVGFFNDHDGEFRKLFGLAYFRNPEAIRPDELAPGQAVVCHAGTYQRVQCD